MAFLWLRRARQQWRPAAGCRSKNKRNGRETNRAQPENDGKGSRCVHERELKAARRYRNNDNADKRNRRTLYTYSVRGNKVVVTTESPTTRKTLVSVARGWRRRMLYDFGPGESVRGGLVHSSCTPRVPVMALFKRVRRSRCRSARLLWRQARRMLLGRGRAVRRRGGRRQPRVFGNTRAHVAQCSSRAFPTITAPCCSYPEQFCYVVRVHNAPCSHLTEIPRSATLFFKTRTLWGREHSKARNLGVTLH